MKKIIALVLSVVMMFSCLGIVASATNVVGKSCAPLGKPECTTACPKPERPTCPTKPECTTKEECTTIINNVTNVTNNNITIMPEEDPSTLLGFLYRVIKTVVPYLYKILSLLNIEISFGGNNANCDNCGSSNGCNCGNDDDVNDDYIIVIPSVPSVEEPTGGVSGDSDSADSDSADSDSDSMDSILGGLFGDLFA